jgi:hypothetical protein
LNNLIVTLPFPSSLSFTSKQSFTPIYSSIFSRNFSLIHFHLLPFKILPSL